MGNKTLTDWDYIDRLEFEEKLKLNPYEWVRTVGEKKTKHYKKYSLWVSKKYGGLWVEDP